MYRIGRPTVIKKPKKRLLLEQSMLLLLVAGLVFGFYWFVIRNAAKSTAFNNNDKPLVSTIKASDVTTYISEPTFKLDLPGTWKETARNTDSRYKSVVWDQITKGGIGRWIKVFVDTIPTEYMVNYVMPVSADGDKLAMKPMSEICVEFTPGANKGATRDISTPSDKESLPSTYKNVKFTCDNSHVSRQVVGTASSDGINSFTVTGATQGSHKYLIIYNDDNYHADYTLFSTILDSFQAK